VKVWLYKGEVPTGSRAEREAAAAAEALRQRRDRPSRQRRSGSQGTTGVSTEAGRAASVEQPELQESPVTSEAEARADIRAEGPSEVLQPEGTAVTEALQGTSPDDSDVPPVGVRAAAGGSPEVTQSSAVDTSAAEAAIEAPGESPEEGTES